MRFALWPHPSDAWEVVVASAKHAEATGWDGVYFADHFLPAGYPPALGPIHECWTTMSAVAATTTRIRVGSLVSCAAFRHPALVAQMAATLDQITGGRVVLGVGAGWQENEHRAYGFQFGSPAERVDRLEEACRIIVGLLRRERTTFSGSYYSVLDAPLDPQPRQARLPLLIGGSGPRVLGLVARYADEWNMWGSPRQCQAVGQVLGELCAVAGRNAGSIVRSAQALVVRRQDRRALPEMAEVAPSLPADTSEVILEAMTRYQEAGVDEFVVPMFQLGTLAARIDFMDEFLATVAPLRC